MAFEIERFDNTVPHNLASIARIDSTAMLQGE